MGVQGLADGFLAGFQTADGAISRDKELTLRDASLQHQIKDSDRTYSLRDAEQKHRVKTDERDFNYKGERDKVGDQQWTLSHALNKQQVGISAANSKLNRQKFEFELDAAKRHELDKQSEPFIYAMGEAIANKDYESAWKFSEKLPKHSPYKMDYWKEADTQKGVDTTFDNMSDMLTGKVDPASPELSKAITLTLGPELSVGVGSKLPDGRTIVGKEVANVLPAKDGQPGFYFTLRNKLDDGSTYEAPVTKYRSHDKEDKEVMFVPYEKIQKVIGERKQMVDMMRSPGMVDYLSNTLNRMNKKDSGSIKEYRSALLDVDKDEAKQMAELNKDGAMLDEAQKAAAVKAIQEGANQRRERVGQLFGVGSTTNNDSTSGGIPPAVKQWAGDDPDKNQVMSELQARGLFKGQNPTPQQLDSVYAGFVQKRGGQKSENQSDKLPDYGSVAPLNKTPGAINNNYGQMNFGTMDLDTISGMRDQIHAYKNELEQTELIHLRARLQQGRKMNEGDKAKSSYLTAMIEDVEEELGNRGLSLKGLRDIGPKVDTSRYQDSYDPQRYRLRDAGK